MKTFLYIRNKPDETELGTENYKHDSLSDVVDKQFKIESVFEVFLTANRKLEIRGRGFYPRDHRFKTISEISEMFDSGRL